MDLFTRRDLWKLLTHPTPPYVSLFMPTHPGGAEADPIRWKNLIRQAREELNFQRLAPRQIREVLGPAERLLEDASFWTDATEGLACFLAPGLVRHYRLPLPFPELAVVAGHFHVKPVLPLLTEEGRFYVLALSQNRVRLLLGTAHRVQEINVHKAPQSLADALRFTDRDEPLLFHTRPAGGKGRWAAIFHGHGVGIDDVKDDLLRYLQAVDQGLHDLFRAEHNAPLVLASVAYLWPIYRQANTYPGLLEQGIAGNPDRLSDKELHDLAWPLVQPYFAAAKRRAAALYRQLAGTGRTSSDVEEVVRAAREGQIETLFLCRDRQLWGNYDEVADKVQVHEQPGPADEDLLNYAAIQTMVHRGTVYPVPADELPGQGPLAAVFWLPFVKHGR